jgi:hypothetical protein
MSAAAIVTLATAKPTPAGKWLGILLAICPLIGGRKMNSLNIPISEHTPLLLRRTERIPDRNSLGVKANMTVVTTPGNNPEMHDQQQDATAPRND